MRYRIGVLEDDEDQAALVRAWLEESGHQVVLYSHPNLFWRDWSRETFDILLLDWDLPGSSGLQVLERLRRDQHWTGPVLFCTRMDSEDQVVDALSAGADDYLVKPLKRRELLARLETVARRMGLDPVPGVIELPPFRVDRNARVITINDQAIELTSREFELSLFLFERQGQVVSRTHLLEVVWQRSADVNTRTVDVHISRLRRKLRLGEDTGWALQSVYQHGYRLARMHQEDLSTSSAA